MQSDLSLKPDDNIILIMFYVREYSSLNGVSKEEKNSRCEMFITRAIAPTEELLDTLNRLIPQLKANFLPPTQEEISKLLTAESSMVYLARHPGKTAPIVGILTLVLYRVPTGIPARIEDLVVDESVRGQGIGEGLVRHAIRVAHESGADGVTLTSNPKRIAANKLYQKIGFKRWNTNVYYFRF